MEVEERKKEKEKDDDDDDDNDNEVEQEVKRTLLLLLPLLRLIAITSNNISTFVNIAEAHSNQVDMGAIRYFRFRFCLEING